MKTIYFFMTLLCIVLIHTSCSTHMQTPIFNEKVDESKILYEPEQQPCYLSGGNAGLLSELYTTLSKKALVTQECVTGRAVIKFSISKNGIIDPNSIKILSNKSVPEDYLDAAIEAIKNLGEFEPGKMNGTPTKVWYSLPIIYPIPLDKIKASE